MLTKKRILLAAPIVLATTVWIAGRIAGVATSSWPRGLREIGFEEFDSEHLTAYEVLLDQTRVGMAVAGTQPSSKTLAGFQLRLRGRVGDASADYLGRWNFAGDTIDFVEEMDVESHHGLEARHTMSRDGGRGPEKSVLARWFRSEEISVQTLPHPDRDGALLKLGSDVELTLRRIVPGEAPGIWSDLADHRIDPGYRSSPRVLSDDLARLRKTASACVNDTEQLEKTLKRSIQEVSYSTLRWLTDLRRVCSAARDSLMDARDPAALRARLTDLVRPSTPDSLLSFLPATAGETPPLEWQPTEMPNRLNEILERAADLRKVVTSLEQERKSRVNLNVRVGELAPTAILQAVLQAKTLDFTLTVVPHDGKTVPETTLDIDAGPSDTILARVTSLCNNGEGLLHVPFQGKEIGDFDTLLSEPRGFWSERSRRWRLDLVLQHAAAQPSCRRVEVLAVHKRVPEAAALIRAFEAGVLNFRQRVQLSNQAWKQVPLFPGVWEMSLIQPTNGRSLGRREFDSHERTSLLLDFPSSSGSVGATY